MAEEWRRYYIRPTFINIMIAEFFSSKSSLYWDFPLSPELMRTMWSRKSPNSLLLEVIPNTKCPCWGGWVLLRITYSVIYFSSQLKIILLEAFFIPFLLLLSKRFARVQRRLIFILYIIISSFFFTGISSEKARRIWTIFEALCLGSEDLGMLLISPTNISRFPNRN